MARAGREEATPDAATAAAPAVRPGPTSTVGAAPQGAANNDPGQGSANTAEPQLAEPPSRAADPQLAADPTVQPPATGASSPTHAAAAAAARATPETVANLAGQIVKKLGARTTQFDLQLNPAGLGKVNVRIEINADGRVSAAMSFDTPQAAAELRSRANELQRALAQSGFDVTGGLSFDVAQDQGRGGSGQQNAFQNNENSGQAFRGRAFAAALETAGDAAQAALINRRATPSGVDVRI
ncbi:flagellar hook-length control protein FliK [Phenylobacterium sp. LjRoot225]|uniref:flagellar hook-length control protein FliK n=1 Tax=Phenylobacterium sp. LjRoot225 TaxID=3342285 RepID=UPI003ED06578